MVDAGSIINHDGAFVADGWQADDFGLNVACGLDYATGWLSSDAVGCGSMGWL